MCSRWSCTVLVALIAVAGYFLYKPLPPCLNHVPFDAQLMTYAKLLCDFAAPTLERHGIINSLDLARMHTNFFMKRGLDTDNLQSYDTFFDLVPVRIYKPAKSKDNGPALFYIHGGGWVLDSINTYDKFVRQLAEELNIFTVSVDYRLAPELRYPAAINDVERAFRHFHKHAGEYKIDPLRIAVAGDSAGGNLAAALTIRLRNRATSLRGAQVDQNDPQIKFQILLYPTLQAVNFSTVSMLRNKDDMLLSRSEMLAFVMQYALGTDYLRNATLRTLAERYVLQGCYRQRANSKVEDVFIQGGQSDIRERILDDEDRSFVASLRLSADAGQLGSTCKIRNEAHLGDIYERLESLLDPEFSPLLVRSVERLPPAYVVSCAHDVLRDDALLYVERLRAASVAVEHKHYPDECHGFLVFNPAVAINDLRLFLGRNALL